MIQELLDLSHRLTLTGSNAFAMRPVHWLIDLDTNGRLLGFVPTVRSTVKKGGKLEEEQGKQFECPVFFFATAKKHFISATAGGGKAVAELAAGNIAEVFGVLIEAKRDQSPRAVLLPEKDAYKHANFLDLHQQLADSAQLNPTVQAVWRFLSTNEAFPIGEFAPPQLKKMAAQQFSFRVAGRLLLTDPDVRRWWEQEFALRRSCVVNILPPGRDLFPLSVGDPCTGALTPVFPHISGVPGGGGWCPLASFDKAPSQSFGLGSGTLQMRLETAERAGAALNWLLRDESSHIRLGDTVAVFWAASSRDSNLPPREVGFAELMAESDPLEVREFLTGPWGKQPRDLDDARFYAAVLSSPQSRITVRSWHTQTLPNARQNLRSWFEAIALPRQFGSGEVYPSIGQLAACTVRKSREAKPLPGTYAALVESALFGSSLPKKLLAQALVRQKLELAIGSDRNNRAEFDGRLMARTALIQVYLQKSQGEAMPTSLVDLETNVGYICGRLLAFLDRIHEAAHQGSGGTNTSPANRAYGAASATPALIYPQLCKLARYHLNKIGGGLAHHLEFGPKDAPSEGLCGIFASLRATGSEFPRTLSLEDQGRFAIGFYTERHRRWAKDDGTTNGAKAAP